MRLKRQEMASIGAILLAFLASQYHNIHMATPRIGVGRFRERISGGERATSALAP
jgi:hypothetical protein